MKLKMNILQRILVYILGTAIVLCTVVFMYVSLSARKSAYRQSIEFTDSYAKQYAKNVEEWLNNDFAVTRTLAAAFKEYENLPTEQWLKLFREMYYDVFATTPHIDAFWDSWELKDIDPNWDKEYGRYFSIVYYENGRIKTKREIRSLDGNSAAYQSMISHDIESIEEPYTSELQGGEYMSTLCSPIRSSSKRVGLIAADIKLTRFQKLVNSIKPYPNSQAFLISNKGHFVAHHDTSIFGKNIADRLPELNQKFAFLANVQKGKYFNFTTNDAKGQELYYTVAPVVIGETQTPWALGILVPQTDILAEANHSYNMGVLISIAAIIILIVITIIVAYGITKPIKIITLNLKDLALGKVDKSMIYSASTNDEIADMSAALSDSIQGIFEKTQFAKRIGDGDLNAEVTLLSEHDVLGKSLIEMRDNLRKASADDKIRQEEELKKKWINEGLAKFGDILRQNNDNIEQLSDNIIKNLVWYLNASLGGLFIINEKDDTKTFDLVSCYAYDRKRIIKESYELSEGLIGACASEREIILLTEIPQDYIEITSGLGDTNPNSLFLVPLIDEDEVLGVIEIASLQKFKKHEVDFVKELARSIASTLHTVKVNSLTNELFNRSKQQAEMMSAQEEEMRQNLEELQATQEEATRKSYELEGLVNALNASLYVMEYDINGFVISVNDGYLEILNARREDVIGVHHLENIIMSDIDKQNYDTFWKDLLGGQIKKRKTRINVNGKERLLLETYTAIFNERSEVFKVLKIATDITNL